MIGVPFCTPISQYFTTVCTDIQRCDENEARQLCNNHRHLCRAAHAVYSYTAAMARAARCARPDMRLVYWRAFLGECPAGLSASVHPYGGSRVETTLPNLNRDSAHATTFDFYIEQCYTRAVPNTTQ